MKKTLLLIALVLVALLLPACGTAVKNPCTQEYVPGEGNIIGTLDPDYFDSVSPDFAIGATAEGVPVFKDPYRAFRTLKKLYAEDIRLIAQENDLPPLSQKTYMSYRDMGHQMEGATAGSRFVSAVLDIYKNSFIDLSWAAYATSPTDLEEAREQTTPSTDGIGVYARGGAGLARITSPDNMELKGDLSPAGLIFPETPEDPDFPVLVNPYPVGQGGPLYEITPEMREETEKRVESFLELLYNEYPLETVSVSKSDYATYFVTCESEEWAFSAGPNGNNFSILDTELAELLPDGDLRQNPILAVVLDYMGIDDPQVEYTVRYFLNDQANDTPIEYTVMYFGSDQICDYEYYIYQKTDDTRQHTLNRDFNSVSIYVSGEDPNHFSVFFDKQERTAVDAELPAVTLEQALGEVERFIPDLDRSEVKARVRYMANIREEYLIPCWELYVPTANRAVDGTTIYLRLWVPTLDTAALE